MSPHTQPHSTLPWLLSAIPFLMVVNNKPQVNTAQIIQWLIIAGVSGMVAAYITITKLEVQFEAFAKANDEAHLILKEQIQEIHKDFYVPRQ